MFLTLDDFKKRIEVSLVANFLNEEETKKICKSAINAGAGVICVNPNYIKLVKNQDKVKNKIMNFAKYTNNINRSSNRIRKKDRFYYKVII